MGKKSNVVRILGAGEAFDAGWGNNACLFRGPGAPTVLFDCGYQIPERLWGLAGLYPALDAVCFTHFHADHSFGIVPLLVRFSEERRRRPLRLIGPRGIEAFARRLLDMGYPGARARLPFALEFEGMEPGGRTRVGSLSLSFARSSHPVMNLSVRVDARGGGSFAVSGDGAPTEETRRLFEGVGLLLHETYFLRPEPGHGRRNPDSHASLEELVELAREGSVGRLGLTHCSRGERARIERAARRLDPGAKKIFVARPGREIIVR